MDPQYILKVTVLTGNGKETVLEWETGMNYPDPEVEARLEQADGSMPLAMALAHVHDYDILGHTPTIQKF